MNRPRLQCIAALGLLAAAGTLAGCRSLTDPFLGVAEWRTVRYGDEDPDSPLKDVPKITAVEKRDYGHYIRSVSTGRVVAREVRDKWVYYAVASRRVIRLPSAEEGEPQRTVALIYERYKARQPPKPPPAIPIEKPATGQKNTSTRVLDEDARKELKEELRRREEKIERRLNEQGSL